MRDKPEKSVKRIVDVDSLVDCDRKEFMYEIQVAYRRWKAAQIQFNYAKEQDEIDYAIYMLKAAEIKMSMLLRKAKRAQFEEYVGLNYNWLRAGDEAE